MALFLVLVIGTAMFASKMLADLFGLVYLLASPMIYRVLKTWAGTTGDTATDRIGSRTSS